MKHLDEFNDPELARRLLDEIARVSTRPAVLMEVCGGQTHSIIRHGIDQLLPPGLELLHGPGCPVCVTPLETIDRALAIAALTDVVFCSFGDMLRVPGSTHDLLTVKSRGGDVRVVYSPLDAVRLAERHPERQVVFFAVGFETTAPANALAVEQARRLGLDNFSLLVSHVLVPPALEAILQAPTCRVQGFLAAGHVCAVMGVDQYRAVCDRYRVPIVITGFEPLDLLDGIRRAVLQLETGRAQVENACTGAAGPGVRGACPHLARHRADSRQRVATAARLSGIRRRSAFRCRPNPRGRVAVVSFGRGAARPDRSHRMPRLRPRVHTAHAAGGDDGVGRGHMCGLLHSSSGGGGW